MQKGTAAFFAAPPAYYAAGDLLSRKENTLSIESCRYVVSQILDAVTESGLGRPTGLQVLDIAGGTGYFSFMLAQSRPDTKCAVLDLSPGMLAVGLNYLHRKGNIHQSGPSFVCCDAHHLCIGNRKVDVALLFCALHLMDIRQVLSEAERVLRDDGWLFALTWDPQELKKTMYHRYFPRFAEFDLPRYAFFQSFLDRLVAAGFDVAYSTEVMSELVYESVDEAVAVVARRPFSVFHLMSQEQFCAGIRTFESRLRRRFGQGPVLNSAKMTLICARVVRV